MKSKLIALIIGLFFASNQLSANNQDLPIPQHLMLETVGECFSLIPPSPYLRQETSEAMILGVLDPILDDDSWSLVFLEVEFRDQAIPTKGIVAVSFDKANKTCQAKLLCLTDGELISPGLFFDIMNGPQLAMLCPKGLELVTNDDALIFVHTDDQMIQKDTRFQTWTFYTPYESCEIVVSLISDGQGGTYFTLEKP